jgi:broad specificity phosphatase PhoE
MSTQRLFSPTAAWSSSSSIMPKTLYILRHGQAMHNPRAEEARANGCSKDEFLELMRQDDCFDAPLTDLGREQATAVRLPECPTLVVASPLSRALATADLALCSSNTAEQVSKYICYEEFREINGWLLNAKRRPRHELQIAFPHWDFSDLSDHDMLWDTALESEQACGERGYQGLRRLMSERSEESILLVVHGGLLSFTMNHPQVDVRDHRVRFKQDRSCRDRFSNCELRKYTLEVRKENCNIVLTEVDMQ